MASERTVSLNDISKLLLNDEHAELTKQIGSRLETQTPSCSTNEFTNNDHSFELDSMDVDIRNTMTPCGLDTDGIVDSLSATNHPILFYNGMPLTAEELMLYAALQVHFLNTPFKAHRCEKYVPVVGSVFTVFGIKFATFALRNYLHRSVNNTTKNFGKEKGRLRWVYFRKTVSDAVDKYHDDLEKLTNLEKLPEHIIYEIKIYLENICNELSGVWHEDHEIDKVQIK